VNTFVKLRYASALAGFALAISFPGIAGAANFAGSWAFSGTLGNPVLATSAPICVFRQNGSAISGSCKGPYGIGSANGSVNGSAIYFQWHVIATRAGGLGGIATYHGYWGGDGVVRGTWWHSTYPGIVGNFTGQKV